MKVSEYIQPARTAAFTFTIRARLSIYLLRHSNFFVMCSSVYLAKKWLLFPAEASLQPESVCDSPGAVSLQGVKSISPLCSAANSLAVS